MSKQGKTAGKTAHVKGEHSADALARYQQKARAELARAERAETAIHVGRGNSKTAMVNESTVPGTCGTCHASAAKDCERICYAIWHMANIYKACLHNYAENTVARRRDPVAYYRAFFQAANAAGCALRVNESGDFERVEDVRALELVAREFPGVRVIGYSKRYRLLPAIAKLNELPNVCIHFSLACHGRYEDHARTAGVPCTTVTTDVRACNCPFQLLKLRGVAGSWHCATCAARKCGCFSAHDVHFLAH
jgi:hypothetical protein